MWYEKHLSPAAFLVILIIPFVVGSILIVVFASEDPDSPEMKEWLDSPPELNKAEDGWVYGKLHYDYDIKNANGKHLELFMLLMAHPKSKVPKITGGYAETDVWVTVRVRGIQVPRALHTAEERHRPHLWLGRERKRWDATRQYIWNVSQNTLTFKVGNFEVVEEDGVLKADFFFLLGGAWHDLDIALLNDKHALPSDNDWEFGDKEFGLVNPNIP